MKVGKEPAFRGMTVEGPKNIGGPLSKQPSLASHSFRLGGRRGRSQSLPHLICHRLTLPLVGDVLLFRSAWPYVPSGLNGGFCFWFNCFMKEKQI